MVPDLEWIQTVFRFTSGSNAGGQRGAVGKPSQSIFRFHLCATLYDQRWPQRVDQQPNAFLCLVHRYFAHVDQYGEIMDVVALARP